MRTHPSLRKIRKLKERLSNLRSCKTNSTSAIGIEAIEQERARTAERLPRPWDVVSRSTKDRGISEDKKSVAPSSVHEPLGCIAARKSVVDQRFGAMCPQRLPSAFSSSRKVSIRRVNPTRLPIASTRSWSPTSLTVPFRSDIIR